MSAEIVALIADLDGYDFVHGEDVARTVQFRRWAIGLHIQICHKCQQNHFHVNVQGEI